MQSFRGVMKLGCITCRREARWLGKVDFVEYRGARRAKRRRVESGDMYLRPARME